MSWFMALRSGAVCRKATNEPLPLPVNQNARRREIYTLLALNVFDVLLTVLFLRAGVADEANPIMRFAYLVHPAVFVAVKTLLAFGGTILLAQFRDHPWATWGLKLCTLSYVIALAYQILYLARWALSGLVFSGVVAS